MSNQLLVGGLGAAVGAAIPGVGWMMGLSIGMTVGGLVFPPKLGSALQRTDRLNLNRVHPGEPIPRVWGRARVPGQLLWAGDAYSVEEREGGGKGAGKGGSYTTEELYCSLAIGIAQGPIEGLRRIWMNKEIVYERDGSPERARWFPSEVWDPIGDLMLGTEAQNPHSLLVSALGAGETPAYRGLAYVVFDDLPITRFGGGVPQCEFEVSCASPPSLASVLEDLLVGVGLEVAELDLSELAGTPCRGLALTSQQDVSAVLASLQVAYSFDLVEHGGQIVAVRRGGTTSWSIPWRHVGLAPGDSRLEVTRRAESERPTRVEVKYFSDTEGQKLQVCEQSYERPAGIAPNTDALDVPVVLTRDEAKRLAAVRAHLAWTSSTAPRFTLPPRYVGVLPSDLILLSQEMVGSVAAGPFLARVVGVRIAGGGQLIVSAETEDPSIYTQTLLGSDEGDGSGGLDEAAPLYWDVRPDLPSVGSEWAGGFYSVAYAGSDSPMGTFGGSLVIQGAVAPGSPEYGPPAETTLRTRSAVGPATTSMGAWATPWLYDSVSTVRISLQSGVVESCTLDQLYQGRNLAILGNEIFAFRTATLVDSNSAAGEWELSGLLRGRFGTEAAAVAGHASGEVFALLDRRSMAMLPTAPVSSLLPGGELRSRVFRMTPADGWDPETKTRAWEDGSVRAWAPVVSVDTTSGLSLTISARCRYPMAFPGSGAPVPLGYDQEAYGVALYAPGAMRSHERQLGADTCHLRIGAVAGEPWSPDPATWTTGAWSIDAGAWAAIPKPCVLEVRQVGVLGALGYRAFGLPTLLTVS